MNPETYPWDQADPEDYNSNDSPLEQYETAVATAWAKLQDVPSYCERYRDAKRAERAAIVARRREMLATGICEHGSSLSLCPACSDLA